MSPERVRLPEISSLAWEHPADRAALQALRRVPGFDLALRKVFGLFTERSIRLITLGSAVEVGPEQYPRVHALYAEVLDVLDAPRPWGLYVSQNPVMNAGAVGMDDPFIVLNSATVQLLTDDQLRVVLAHEVGHIMSDHVLYKTMLRLLLRAGRYAGVLPLAGLPLLAVLAALLEWDRKSELSADRAALLAVQDPEAVRSSLLRLAGGVGEGASVDAFRDQARRYEEEGSALDSVIKTLALLGRRHPFPVQRVKELDRWLESGEVEAILGGAYPRRGDDEEAGAWSAWKDSARAYADGFKSSADPLTRWLRDTSAAASARAGSLLDRIRGDDEGNEEVEDEPPSDEPPEIIDID
ncbi:MAG: M48 family metallopeptidase [Alphaproteobacteria bacterium]|nr:M48 family metallopeptidase [Alphaproteobacteria bacterium]